MDSEERASARQMEFANELRDVEFEIYQLNNRKADLLASIERNRRDGSPETEITRITELIGKCEADILINNNRKAYVERSLKDASFNLELEQKHKLALSPKKPKFKP